MKKQKKETVNVVSQQQQQQQSKKSKTNTKTKTKKESKKRTRTISFNPQVAVKPITPVTQLVKGNDGGLSKLWYTKLEAKAIKEECAQLVEFFESYSMESLLELGQDHPDILKKLLYSIRGLEKHVNADETLQRRYNAWDAVFDEQDIQMQDAKQKQKRIANAYKLHTIESQKDAYERALQDEQEVLYEQYEETILNY